MSWGQGTGNRILCFAGLQTNGATHLESFCASGMSRSRLPGCPHGAGTGHSPAHAVGAAQEGLPTEGRAASHMDSPWGLETAPGAGSPQGLPHPLPLSLWVGLVLVSPGYSRELLWV